MKREEAHLRELVEPECDAGSSARVQRREPSVSGEDPERNLAFGDLFDIPRNYTHHSRKGRHMQRMTEGRRELPARIRRRPEKERGKRKEKEKDRGKKREYYEYTGRYVPYESRLYDEEMPL